MQAPNFFNIILYDVGQSGKRTVVGFFNGIYIKNKKIHKNTIVDFRFQWCISIDSKSHFITITFAFKVTCLESTCLIISVPSLS